MTDRDAILEAIFAAPDDDAPRLVYADWLDEHDHPEQAEFVRRHIEWFRTPAGDARRKGREATLEASWNRFKIELVESLPHTEVRLDLYSRGLPEHDYIIPADRFLLDAPGWWPLFPVRRLSLTGWVERVGDVSRCAYLARVADLTLRFEAVDLDVARVLIASPHLAHVRRLRIDGFPAVTTRAAAQALRGHFGDRLRGVS